MDELVAFVRAQLDEDERKVAAMEREETRVRTAPIFQGRSMAWLEGVDIYVSSKRWRAEVKAKRRVLSWLVDCERKALDGNWWNLEVDDAVKALAQPYAGREGWREEWSA